VRGFLMLNMFITVITDCQDDNAFGRQTTRLSQYFQYPITTVGVKNDLEAAGNLIDILDASEGSEGTVLVNVAPRHKEAKRWENGTPFGYFYYKNTLVISSIDGLTLSLVKKFSLVESINLMDIPTVLENEISLLGGLNFYPRLKDVPDNEVALITGSSGLWEKRFLEIVVQGGSAANILKIKSGQAIDIKNNFC